MKEICKTQLKHVQHQTSKCTAKIEKCKEKMESLELSMDYCSRHNSALNFVTEPWKCETSEEKENEFLFKKPPLKHKHSFVQGIGNILMWEKQEINIAQKHAEQIMNLAWDTAFVQSSAGSSGKTWGSHGLVHDLDQYSVDGIKKNKKEDAEAPCSMEVMAI